MKNPLSIITTVCAIVCLSSVAQARNQTSFQNQYNQLSAQEKAQVKSDAVQKEDYNAMPSVKVLSDGAVNDFCKALPRGLETLFTQKVADNKSPGETRRAHLWAKYLSCKDSLLYYEGHRFFDSGHYTDNQVISAIGEIEKVMNWLLAEEARIDSV